MADYRRVYDSHHLQTDCQEPASAPEPYARQSSMGCLYLYLTVRSYYGLSANANSKLRFKIGFLFCFHLQSFVALSALYIT